MIKVLIVDDELLIRVGIKSCIDWEANGFEVIGLADDGINAMEIMGRERPDIVLTDIKMPNMDGLELIEQIKLHYPITRIIVLSCYNELDYVKRAMKSGADDYILKLSMQPKALLDALNSTKALIDNDKKEFSISSSRQNEIKVTKYFIKEDLYKKVIDGAISTKFLVEELKKNGSTISFSQVNIIYAIIDDYSNASIKSRLKDRFLLKFSVTNIIEEILSMYCKGDIIEIERGEYLLVLDSSSDTLNFKKMLQEFCIKVNSALENYLNISASFGISGLSGDIDSFESMYMQAVRALEQKFYYGRESIIFYDQELEFSDKQILLNFHEDKMLVACLENLDDEGAKAIISRFLVNISNSRVYHPSKVRMAAIEILHSFIKVAKKFEVESEFEQISLNHDENPVDFLMRAETIADIDSWLQNTTERLADCLSNKRLGVERPEILKLKQYISERLYEDISLEMASKLTNMSKNYLSGLFKKETGEAFTDYVNRMKMEEAKDLIQRYGMKTYEAAEKLGYNDESYFSKLFKKYIGINSSKVNKVYKE